MCCAMSRHYFVSRLVYASQGAATDTLSHQTVLDSYWATWPHGRTAPLSYMQLKVSMQCGRCERRQRKIAQPCTAFRPTLSQSSKCWKACRSIRKTQASIRCPRAFSMAKGSTFPRCGPDLQGKQLYSLCCTSDTETCLCTTADRRYR